MLACQLFALSIKLMDKLENGGWVRRKRKRRMKDEVEEEKNIS